jgi:hypothetical protein
MDQGNDKDETKDHKFLLEVAERVSLMDVIPFCVWDFVCTSRGRKHASEACFVRSGREGNWRWVRRSSKIRKVYEIVSPGLVPMDGMLSYRSRQTEQQMQMALRLQRSY